jgi:isocitrate/isopropylmalate dehydrogenase
MVEIDLRRFTMIRGLQIMSPLCSKMGSLAMAREIMIEYFDIDGHVIRFNSGKIKNLFKKFNDFVIIIENLECIYSDHERRGRRKKLNIDSF